MDELPHSVEAMFFLPTGCGGDIYDGPKCEDYARAAHRRFLASFNLTESEVPLLKFDLWNWDAPFTVAPPLPPSSPPLPVRPPAPRHGNTDSE